MRRDRPCPTRCSAHEPADDDERRDRDAIAALVPPPRAASTASSTTPGHVTGSAFVLDAASGQVLLHHHRRLDRWLQLGGHDDGEHDPLATALREAREESGLPDLRPLTAAILDVDVHAIPAGRGAAAPAPRRPLRPAARRRNRSSSGAESLALAWLPLTRRLG